jgi:hypothetical protein
MKLEEYYTIGELLQLREESARNEFKPKFGNGAKRTSSDNDKAVKDIIKNAEELDKDGRRDDKPVKPRVEFPDYNKTTLDVNFEYEPDEAWKKRVEAQAKGYPSVQNKEKNDYDKSLGFDGNEDFYKARKQMSKVRNDADTIERESGLKARIKKDEIDYSNKTSFVNEEVYNVQVFTQDKRRTKEFDDKDDAEKYAERTKKDNPNYQVQLNDRKVEDADIKDDDVKESKQIKRIKFKNTTFLDESHVLSKVPEDYKIDENRFYMQDKTGTDYLVECKADPFGYIHMEVVNKFNKKIINEELEKMKRLAGYKYSDDNKKVDTKKLEDMSESISNFRELLNN